MLTRLFEWIIELWDRLQHGLGFDRVKKSRRQQDLPGHSLLWRIFYFGRPLLALLVILYLGAMIWRFSWIRGEDLGYPQAVIAEAEGLRPADGVAPSGGETEGEGLGPACGRSQIVAVTTHLLDMLVNENDWTPATPQYKIGFFWLVNWRQTPFFDNKAAFQSGSLRALRRMSIELNDSFGRARGTSAPDDTLQTALGRMQVDESTWLFNPFDENPTFATSAASAYRQARELYLRYNEKLQACDTLFDARGDNLFQFLDRVSKDLGAVSDTLAERSQGVEYDPETHSFRDAAGNNRGWFDFHAADLFHEARGLMYAYHGIMQAAREDFAQVAEQRALADIWDRMEAHIAEAAALDPLLVSNGSEDGMFMPAHLSAMAQNILRARANMTELREILNR